MEPDNDQTQSFIALAKGTEVGHYKIIDKIGVGGMGEVYLAEDTKLKRNVALKFLPQHLCQDHDCRERFKREAQAAAKLNHPNIITIHEVSEFKHRPFFVMEYCPGETLKAMLVELEASPVKAVEIAIQIADGLDKAHKAGIIHRDIKPSNIFIDSEGRVKILDFGLAAVQGSEHLTKTGSTMGTIGYMSPEQIEGVEVDHRSDLFSLGVVLYEMLTGTSPFKKDNQAATFNAILNSQPKPLSKFNRAMPPDLERIVNGLLQKEPARRYRSASDVADELKQLETSQFPVVAPKKPVDWWNRYIVTGAVAIMVIIFGWWLYQDYVEGPSESKKPKRIMLAVLPFENLGQAEDEYFADGITDAINTRLASISRLGVISRTSAMAYKDSKKVLPVIAAELGVDYILEGTILWDKSGAVDRIRVIPQLIEVSSDMHLWSDEINSDLTDLFAVQAEIATQITNSLGITLLEPEKQAITAEPTQNLEAYNYYLRGKEYWIVERDPRQAAQMFEKAVELDGNFYQAYRMLSQMHGYMYINNWADPEQSTKKAKEAAEKALHLANGDPEGYLAMGYYHYYCSRDYESALEQFELALKGQPNNSDLLEAIGYVQRRWGRWDEALANMQKAYELDPRNGSKIDGLSRTLFYMHRVNEAKRVNEIALTWDSTSERTLIWQMFLSLMLSEDSNLIYDAINRFEQNASPAGVDYWLEKIDVIKRDYKSALSRRDGVGEYMISDSSEYYWTKGEIYHYLGDSALSRIYYDSSRAVSEGRVANNPDNYNYRISLANAYARLGRHAEAITEGEKAAEMMPVSKDALEGPGVLASLAGIYIIAGDHERAIDLLDSLLVIPSAVQVRAMRLYTVYDPLRNNPRFQEMIDKYEEKYGSR